MVKVLHQKLHNLTSFTFKVPIVKGEKEMMLNILAGIFFIIAVAAAVWSFRVDFVDQKSTSKKK